MAQFSSVRGNTIRFITAVPVVCRSEKKGARSNPIDRNAAKWLMEPEQCSPGLLILARLMEFEEDWFLNRDR